MSIMVCETPVSICKECKYFKKPSLLSMFINLASATLICLHEDHKTVDYITGVEYFGKCREWNSKGECKKYEKKTIVTWYC